MIITNASCHTLKEKVGKFTRKPVSYLNFYLPGITWTLFSTKTNDENNDDKTKDSKNIDIKKTNDVKLPEEPQNCCMSGCANCVWIAYAEELAQILNDGGETAKAKIMENVKDPNLRAFLLLELSHLFDKKKK